MPEKTLTLLLKTISGRVRIAYRKGRADAVSTTARKLGIIIWTMIKQKIAYKPPTEYLFLDQKSELKL